MALDGPRALLEPTSVEEAEQDLENAHSRFMELQSTLERKTRYRVPSSKFNGTSHGWRQWEGAWDPKPIGRI